MLRWRHLFVGFVVLVVIGCGGSGKKQLPTYKCKGKVTMGGKPFGPCQLALEPKPLTPELKSSIATVGADGTFSSVRTYKPGDGIPAGSFEVKVLQEVMGGPEVPGYNQKVIVVEKQSGVIDLKIDLEPNGKTNLPRDENSATIEMPAAVP